MRRASAVLSIQYPPLFEERAIPAPGPKEVLVEIKAVGVCGSDVHWYEHGHIGAVVGHEASGVIVDLGAEVTEHTVGEHLALEPGVPFGTPTPPTLV